MFNVTLFSDLVTIFNIHQHFSKTCLKFHTKIIIMLGQQTTEWQYPYILKLQFEICLEIGRDLK